MSRDGEAKINADFKLLENRTGRQSLLELHLKWLDSPKDESNPEWKVIEGYRQGATRNLALSPELSKPKRNKGLLFISAAALAASIAVVVTQNNKSTTDFEELNFKGNAKVFVIVETASGISTWDGKSPLSAGTKINAEILTAQDAVAFAAVYDRSGRLLTSENSIANSKIQLNAGIRGHFNNAFELTTENDGEQFITVVCDRTSFEQNPSKNIETLTRAMTNKPDKSFKPSLPYCGIEQFTLRH